jgi:hypothetical protein
LRKQTIAIVALLLVGTRTPARAEDGAGPSTRPAALEDRVSQLEARLDDVLRRIEVLRRKVDRLSALPDVVGPAPPADAPATQGVHDRFVGRWRGSLRNSKGDKNGTTLVLAVDDGRVSGKWDTLSVTGTPADANSLRLSGTTPDKSYEITVELDESLMTIKYVATYTTKKGSYSGKCTLTRVK